MKLILLSTAVLALSVVSGCDKENPVDQPKYKVTAVFKNAVSEVLTHYFEMHEALTQDDFEKAKANVKKLLASIDQARKIDNKDLAEEARTVLENSLKKLSDAAAKSSDSRNLEGSRNAFVDLSDNLIDTVRNFGHNRKKPLQLYYCGMKKAYWLQQDSEEHIKNPYFGKDMLG